MRDRLAAFGSDEVGFLKKYLLTPIFSIDRLSSAEVITNRSRNLRLYFKLRLLSVTAPTPREKPKRSGLNTDS